MAQAGDRWLRVADFAAAASTVAEIGRRVFLTTGRQRLDAFMHLSDLWLLARVVDEPDGLCRPMWSSYETVGRSLWRVRQSC